MNSPYPHWQKPLPFPLLKEGEVHVWLANLDKSLTQLDYFKGLLSINELERAKRYKVENPYRGFVITRGLLREILGRYLGHDPREITIVYNENGKPFADVPVHFSISHSKNLVLLAFCREQAVGVDIQYKQEIRDIDELSIRFFSKQESDEVLAAGGSTKIQAFYDIWVRKESYTKAMGARIADVLGQYKNNNLHIDENTDYWFENIVCDDSYAAVLATKTKQVQLKYWLIGP